VADPVAAGPASWDVPLSAVPGIRWPSLVHPRAATLLALLFQLEKSERWGPEALAGQQKRQLDLLVRYAMRQSPYYRETLGAAGLRPGDRVALSGWQQLPILSRDRLQAAGKALDNAAVPRGHGAVHQLSSGGSTGRPVSVRTTDLCRLFYKAISLRDNIWHRRDASAKHVAIRHRPGTPSTGTSGRGWGAATAGLYATGPSATLHSATDLRLQAEWLVRQAPQYLLAYPSNVEGLARIFIEKGLSVPDFRQVRTFGESLGPAVRDLCAQAWGVPLVDTYSAQEVGHIALQCPLHEHYHVQSESVLVEVVDDQGRPCQPGQTGRVLVTPLHNFATPLIRYELGDHAEVGEPCDCGRGLPVLKRILGRTRNLLRLPDGRRYRPAVGTVGYRRVAPAVRQAQLVQRSLEDVEARLVVSEALSPAQERQLIALIQESLGFPFRVTPVYVSEIPRSSVGKFEDFLCLMGEGSGAG
jgi:phenylacetate-CoA ligase